MRFFLLVILAFPFVLISQNKLIVFVEAGNSINQSFYPTENVSGKLYYDCTTGGGDGSYGNYYTIISRTTEISYYSRIGIETSIIRKKHFSFSIPFALGYRKQKENYTSNIEEIYYYNDRFYRYSSKTQNNSEIFGLIFGPKATMGFKNWSFFTSINMNTNLFFNSKSTTTINRDFGSYRIVSSGEDNGITFNVSLQNGLLFNVSSKLSIGLTGDIFFYNFDPNVIQYNKKDNHFFNLGYGTNSTIINTGIRLQYSF